MRERHVCIQRYSLHVNSVPTMETTLTTMYRSVWRGTSNNRDGGESRLHFYLTYQNIFFNEMWWKNYLCFRRNFQYRLCGWCLVLLVLCVLEYLSSASSLSVGSVVDLVILRNRNVALLRGTTSYWDTCVPVNYHECPKVWTLKVNDKCTYVCLLFILL